MPVAVAADLWVRRGGKDILKGMSLALDPGLVTVLLGPNGAGKTTLIEAFCGALPARRGTVSIGGCDPRRDREARRRIGLVPQEVALYGRLTVRENLETFAALAGTGTGSKRGEIDRALDLAGLERAGSRLVSALSGGMQRRANIACALVGRPSLLLLDEPTVGLDVEARLGISAVLRRLTAEIGSAVLLTTHDMGEAEAVADAVAIMEDGRLLIGGSPPELIATQFKPTTRRAEAVLNGWPSEAAEAGLRAAGFVPSVDRVTWVGLIDVPADQVLAAFDRFGVGLSALREWRVRRPGLDDVYRRSLARAHGP